MKTITVTKVFIKVKFLLVSMQYTIKQYKATVERRLSERQSSETSNIRTHIFFVLRSNNEKSAITSRSKVLCHFY
jgi:hypothetical protein